MARDGRPTCEDVKMRKEIAINGAMVGLMISLCASSWRSICTYIIRARPIRRNPARWREHKRLRKIPSLLEHFFLMISAAKTPPRKAEHRLRQAVS
jgi:hypothetical protein